MGENPSGKNLHGPIAEAPRSSPPTSIPSVATGAAFVLIAAALWAIIGPLSRFMLGAGLHPLEMAVWRAAIAWVLFGAHLAVSRSGPDRWRVDRRDLPGIAALGILGVAALYATLPLAVREGGAALAAVLLYTAPAWVAILSFLILRERLGPRKLTALVLTIGGIAGIAFSGGSEVRTSAAALGWGLASGISYASLFLFGKRYFARYQPATVFFYALPVALLCLLPLAPISPKTQGAWIALLATGVLSTYGAYLAYSKGLMLLEATRAATISTAEPVIAAVLAFIIFGERFSALGYASAMLVIAGVLVAATERRKQG
jgi:drug/metabolite transporter, DME family